MIGRELHAHSSRALHDRPHGPRVRAFGKNESSTSIQQPFGALAPTVAGRISRQQLSPLLMGLGVQGGKKAQQFQKRLESGQMKGPLADAIRSIQQFAPDVLPNAQDVGKRVSTEGEAAVKHLQDVIGAAEGRMPTYQAGADAALTGARAALTGSQDAYQRGLAALAPAQAASARGLAGADEALNLARGYTTGPAVRGAEDAVARARELLRGGAAEGGASSALSLAQRYADRAASPIADEDLYQVATRRVLQQVRPGLAARGLEGGGGGAQMETDALRNMTFDFAQRRAAEQASTVQSLQSAAQGLSGIQQGAISGLGGATSNLGGLQQNALAGLGNAAGGLQTAARSSAELPQTLLPYLSGITNASGGVTNAAQGGATLNQAGVGMAGAGVGAVNQLAQALSQQFGIPMQQAGQLLGLLTGGVQPSTQLLGATGPIATPSSKGFRAI